MGDRVFCNDEGGMVRFREKFTESFRFSDLFQEGMCLVKEVSAYLDEEGRVESRSLPQASALAYAAESMRLTTQLMRLTSWLLLHRAVFEGAISFEKAYERRERVDLQDAFPAFQEEGACRELPESLKRFIRRSEDFYCRIKVIDRIIHQTSEHNADRRNPVRTQVDRLRARLGEPSPSERRREKQDAAGNEGEGERRTKQ